MTNYVLDRIQLKEMLLAHKSYISMRCKLSIEAGIDITTLTFKETDKWTEDFIDTMINTLPLDSLLDQADEVLERVCGTSSRKELERLRKERDMANK